ncbi:MAG TPA: HAD family hydrolase [Bacilli bacterium]
MFKTIFFDLDGTLLLMDQDEFLKYYFAKLSLKFKNEGSNFIDAVKIGVMGMLKNEGSMTNEEAFWKAFTAIYPHGKTLEDKFLDFYQNEFQELKPYTSLHDHAKEVIKILKDKGYDLVLCTNPVFPKLATFSRIMWTGINPRDFIWITTYDNSHYCKPNLNYYQEVLKITNKKPIDVLMVGNDVEEDLCVKELGMKTYLVTDNLLNRKNLEIITDYQGTFNDFYNFVLNLPRKE